MFLSLIISLYSLPRMDGKAALDPSSRGIDEEAAMRTWKNATAAEQRCLQQDTASRPMEEHLFYEGM